ncbi:dodecenoyl-CoA isomerase [Tieghemiomyces parasiticus]|uniref:Dodecenoyl-CoA isomerase n=1 Tax=Tieghemiomyces parasiticus TaxID=78921 RepID=A0A9W8DPT2_9FUNG|nr:dodecenoyl-CoA isomerase [Tieghemiomyces parasiticus]
MATAPRHSADAVKGAAGQTGLGAARIRQLSQHLNPQPGSLVQPQRVRLAACESDATIAVLSFGRPPANTFNLPYLQALDAALNAVLGNRPSPVPAATAQRLGIESALGDDVSGIRTLIITSDLPFFYSAGIDITTFLGKDPSKREPVAKEDWLAFWGLVRTVFIKLYTDPRVRTVAAINGHAPGFGCILALACHDRVMVQVPSPKTPRIGLNEVQVGLTLPLWLGDRFAEVCGQRNAEKYLPFGTTFTARESLAIGLVDQVVDITPEEYAQPSHASTLVRACIGYARNRIYKPLPPFESPAGPGAWAAHMHTYNLIRRAYVRRFQEGEYEDLHASHERLCTDEVQNTLRAALARLQKRD